MADDILNTKVEIKPTKTKSTKSTKVTQTTKDKEQPSLFDNMIKKNDSKTIAKTKIIDSVKTISSKTKVKDKTKNEQSNIEKSTIKTTSQKGLSLLDKMVKDIKISQPKSNTINSKITKKQATVKTTSSIASNSKIKANLKKVQIDAEDIKLSKTIEKDTSKNTIQSTSVVEKVAKITDKEKNLKVTDTKNEDSTISKHTSMMDNFLDGINKATNNPTKEHTIIKNNTNNLKEGKSSISKENKEKNPVNVPKKETLEASMFLSQQKSTKYKISNGKLTEATQILKEDNATTSDIKKSAKILELNLKDISIATKKEDDKKTKIIKDKKDNILNQKVEQQTGLLNKAFLINEKILKQSVEEQTATLKKIINIDDKEVKDSKAKTDDSKQSITHEITLKVDSTVAQDLSTKIISSRQKMQSFMSDMARKMYENYKPPLTAFRMKLNPNNLGSIAITLKGGGNNKALSVSLNMSSSTTLDTLEQNKMMLHSALQRVFVNETNVSLSFGMQNNSSSLAGQQQQQNNQQQQQQNNQQQDEHISLDEQIVEETLEDNQQVSSYM